MSNRSLRLPREEFRSGWRHTVTTSAFSLKAKKNTIGRFRIGVVVGASVHKSAVKRNFWKREVRGALVPFDKPGTDLLVVLSPAAAKLTKKKFREMFVAAVSRLG